MESTAYLIKEEYEQDSLGQFIPSEIKREILCHESSIKQNEFFSAGRNGINADLVLITQAVNYEKEKIIEYDGERYGIYRTYRNPHSDEIELYCEWKGGISGQEDKD